MTPVRVILVLLALLQLSCGSGGQRELLLSEGTPEQAPPAEPAAPTHDARMNIDVDLGTEGIRQLDPDRFARYAAQSCESVILPTGSGTANPDVLDYWAPCMTINETSNPWELGGHGGCVQAYCQVQLRICQANMMLQFATAVSPVQADVFFPGLGGVSTGMIGKASVPPQDTESKASLAELGLRAATDAAVLAVQNLTLLATGQKPESKLDEIPPYPATWDITAILGGAPPLPFIEPSISCTDNPADDADLTVGELWSSTFQQYPTQRVSTNLPDMLASKQTMAEALATMLTDAMAIANEATELATELHVDAADAEFSRTPDRAAAAQSAWVGGTLSRARAAHLNVGGQLDAGLHYLWGQGVCPMDHLDNAAKKALEYFRTSAMDPKVLASDVTIEQVLLGGNGDPFESLRERLADRIPDPDMATLGLDELLEALELPLSAFAQARAYLVHEQVAFGRDLYLPSPGMPVGTDSGGGITLATPGFAATALPPSIPPPMYYAGLARFPIPWDSDCPTPPGDPIGPTETCKASLFDPFVVQLEDRKHNLATCSVDADCAAWEACLSIAPSGKRCFHVDQLEVTPTGAYARQSLSHLIDYVASFSHDLPAFATDFGHDLPSRAADILARSALELRNQRPTRVETCYSPAGPTDAPDQYRIRIMGAARVLSPLHHYLFVRGASGLRCATEGNIEGVPCDVMDYAVVGTYDVERPDPASRPVGLGFEDYVEFELGFDLNYDPVDWLYVAELREGANPFEPGAYEALSVVKLQRMTDDRATSTVLPSSPLPVDPMRLDDWRWCSLAPVVPETTGTVGRILAPSAENCTQPNETCAGFEFAEKIPLENELTDNRDGVEDSWRHYLDAAMSAAKTADELGEQLIDRGFLIDQRIEAAAAEIEGICGGGAANFYENSWGNVEAARVGDCVDDPDSCPSLYTCMNGQCVEGLDAKLADMSKVEDPAQDPLLACMGDASVVPLAALADRPICIWRKPLDTALIVPGEGDGFSKEYCENPLPAQVGSDCPFLANTTDFADHPCEGPEDRPEGLPSDWKVEVVPYHMDAFTPQEASGPKLTDQKLPCELIRKARRALDDVTAEAWAKEVVNQLPLNHGHAVTVASRIGWEPYPGNHSAITVDGEVRWATGVPEASESGDDEPQLAGSWPCGKAYSSVDPAFQKTVCDGQTAWPVTPLFEAYTCGCDDTNTDGEHQGPAARPQFAQRLGRAVIAAKLITGAPFDNVKLPFQPNIANYTWLIDEDYQACPEEQSLQLNISCTFDSSLWKFSSRPYNMFGGRLLETADDLTFEPKAFGHTKKFAQEGPAYCHPDDSTGWSIWWDPAKGDLAPDCTRRGDRRDGNIGGTFPILMRVASDVTSDVNQGRKFFNGMGANNVGEDGLVLSLLKHPSQRQQTKILNTANFTNFFKRCTGNREWDDTGCSGNPKQIYLNELSMAPYGLTGNEVLDALELICEVDSVEGFSCEEVANAVPENVQDLAFIRDSLSCVADSIRTRAAMTVFRDVPADVLPDNSRADQYQGERGKELSNLVQEFSELHDLENELASTIDQFSLDVDALKTGLKKTSVLKQIATLEEQAEIADRMSSCAASVARSAGGIGILKPGQAIGGAIATAIQCANAAKQVSFAISKLDLQNEDLELDGELQWIEFRQKFVQTKDDLNTTVGDINDVLHKIGGSLAQAESHRQRARRLMGQGLMLQADSDGRVFATNAVMSARYTATRIRYERALKDAKYMAYEARRALEQRIGIELMDIEDDLAFVEAPAGWADEVCTFGGIDYRKIGTGMQDGEALANAYIGDYVTKLQQVFESYPVDFPFHEGTDTAVVSMRDDLLGLRGLCEAGVNNLLGESAALEGPSWTVQGCFEYSPDTADLCQTEEELDCAEPGPIVDNCVRVSRIPQEDRSALPIPLHEQASGAVEGYRVVFAPGVDPMDPNPPRTSLIPGSSALTQSVRLEPGAYRLSWRGRPDMAGGGVYSPADAVDAVELVETSIFDPTNGDVVGTNVVEQDVTRSPVHTIQFQTGDGWDLHYFVFEIEEDPGIDDATLGGRLVRIEIRSDSDPAAVTEYGVQIAAMMLENVTGDASVSGAAAYSTEDVPAGYVATTKPGIGMLPVCEDTYGSTFRKGWKYGCEKLCPSGFATCPDGESHCFFEREVSLSLSSLEEKSHLSRAGFAYGNYNYRVDTIAANFVGTGTRNCEDSTSPSTCYASGFIPYSIYHDGAFDVRNHLGESYRAPLYRGVIEHGRGLAAERYITNPIGSADRELLEPYMRAEFAGRPLPGRYVIRIWDEPGVSFEGIEDVQLVVNYRYWTRND